MRKYFLIPLLFFFGTIITKAQMPQLTVDGKTNNGVQLQALKIEVKVCGTVARTTWQMTFKNSTTKILEGTLNFPLKDGLSVSRYALDINGKMREAVPVDRSKGTEVFENIERRRVDPGLLEKVDGNTFRTRIYPINPNNTRTVLIGYEEELPLAGDAALHYFLPLHLKGPVSDFNLSLTVIQSATEPVFDSSLNENLHFTSSNHQYNAALHKNNFVPGSGLSFSIPKPADAAEVMLQEFENKYCYLINTRVQNIIRPKTLPASVCVLWDASLSATNSNLQKETALLDAYLKKLNTVTITLITFSNSIKNTKTYSIQNGNWDALKKDIEAIQYDGATDLGNLNLKNIPADEFLLVSDGHQTIGNKQLQSGNKPVYCITSSPMADYSNLKFIAAATAGDVIDLQNENTGDALQQLIDQPLRFLGIKHNDFTKENYPSLPVIVNNNFAVAGIAEEGIAQIVLQFGYGNTVTYEKTININSETQLCENFDITKIFAQKKIAELDIRYKENKTEIERLGKEFGIVTRNTSLIVLETLNDYLQYQIEPPAELREEYDRIMKERGGDIITKNGQYLQRSLNMMAVLKAWYDQKPLQKEPLATNIPVPQPPVANLAPSPGGNLKMISGRITDKDSNPVSPAFVKIKGTSRGTSATQNGTYSIHAKEGDVLQFSAAGFRLTEWRVGNDQTINTLLGEESQALEEVVVVAYASARKKDITGSVATVNGEEITSSPVTSIASGLEGRTAGLQVNAINNYPTDDFRVTIRGNRSITGNNEALLVVNNVQMPMSYLNTINQNDIANVSILKDAAASALYGSAAANGVIIVTTKNFHSDSLLNTIQNKEMIEKIDSLFYFENLDYIKAIKQTEKDSRYLKYLELRQHFSNKPTYYFDVATYFLKTGDKTNGITVLSNLAELENGSYELYKMLGYKLKEAGDYEYELSAFKKVLELRPSDPQSYRDCALAYADLGNYQLALDMLYEGMTKSYSDEMKRMYNGIEEIFLTEINRLIVLHKKELNCKNIDNKIIAPMPADIRVVMNWNMNNTDIDLWVTDPNGEKCFYSHKTTDIGGRISNDFTQGFGPEQFMLKSGIKGKYKIQVNYYGDRQVTIAGPTTIMAEIYQHYGTDKEEKKIVTLQMEKGKQGEVFIGEVEL